MKIFLKKINANRRKLFSLMFLIFSLLATNLYSQTGILSDVMFPITVGTEPYVPLTNSTQLTHDGISTNSHDYFTGYCLTPFPIRYDTTLFPTGSKIRGMANGWVDFNQSTGGMTQYIYLYGNYPAVGSAYNNLIMICSRDGSCDPADMRWAVLGTAPERRLVIEFTDFRMYSSAKTNTKHFQVIFYESSDLSVPNKIRIHFGGGSGNVTPTSPAIGFMSGYNGGRLIAFEPGNPMQFHRTSTSWTTTYPSMSTAFNTQYAVPNRYIEFGIVDLRDHDTIDAIYKESNVTQSGIKMIGAGATDVPMINLNIVIDGNRPPSQKISQIRFAGKGSFDKISSAKLYFTGTNSAFSKDSLLGTITGGALQSDTFFFFFDTITFEEHGMYYFWLAYDIDNNAINGDTLDASLVNFNLFTDNGPTTINPPTDELDPDGEVMISDMIYVGPTDVDGVPTNTTTSYYMPYYGYNFGGGVVSYSPAELGGGTPYEIQSMAMYYCSLMTTASYLAPWDSLYIFLRNTDSLTSLANTIQNLGFPLVNGTQAQVMWDWLSNPTHGWVKVKGPYTLNQLSLTYPGWSDLFFDTPFQYTGGYMDMMIISKNCSDYYATYHRYPYYKAYTNGKYFYGRSGTANPANIPGNATSWTVTNSTSSANYGPNLRLRASYVDHASLPQSYVESKVEQSPVTEVMTNSDNVAILKLNIKINGDMTPVQTIDNIKFTGKVSIGKIRAAKLYYSGKNIGDFDINAAGTQLLGNLVFSGTGALINTDTFNFAFDPIEFTTHGTYCFWLVYDVANKLDIYVDGKLDNFHLYTTNGNTTIDPYTTTPDPEGAIAITGYAYAGAVNYGVPSSTTTSYLAPYYGYHIGGGWFSYPATDVNNGTPGAITSIALYYCSLSTSTTYQNVWDSVYIFMRNTTSDVVRGYPVGHTNWMVANTTTIGMIDNWIDNPTDGWTLVKGPYSYDVTEFELNAWTDFELDTPFEYGGNYLEIMWVRKNFSDAYSTYFRYPYYKAYNTRGSYFYARTNTTNPPNNTPASALLYTYTTTSASTYQPNLRFTMDLVDHSSIISEYASSRAFTATKTAIWGQTNTPAMRAVVTTSGDLPPYQQVTSMKFTGKGSIGKINNAKLWFTAKNQVFDPQNAQLLSTINFVGPGSVINTDTFNFTFTPINIAPHGKYNFFLTYDIVSGRTKIDSVDAKWEMLHIQNGTSFADVATDVADPVGSVHLSNYIYAGAVTEGIPNTTTTSYLSPYYGYHLGGSWFSYPATDINNGRPGDITNIALYYCSLMTTTTYDNIWDSVYIFMRNSTSDVVRGYPAGVENWVDTGITLGTTGNWMNNPTDGWTLVKGPYEWNTLELEFNTWTDFELDMPFAYEGDYLEVMWLNKRFGKYYASYQRYPYYKAYNTRGSYFYARTSDLANPPTNTDASTWAYTYTTTSASTYQPNLRMVIDYAPGVKFRSAGVFQLSGLAGCGATNVPILGTSITLRGRDEDPYVYASKFVFDGKGSYDNRQIVGARLFYSGTDSVFTTANQVGGTVSVDANNIHNLVFTASEPVQMSPGKHFYWLAYDIESDESLSDQQVIDAKLVSVELSSMTLLGSDADIFSDVDPVGDKVIRAPLDNGVYYVGSPALEGQELYTYSTLAECAFEFSQVGVTKNTIIYIISNTTETLSAEFGSSPYGDAITYTMLPYNSDVTIFNNVADTSMSVVSLLGTNNFEVRSNVVGMDTFSIEFSKDRAGIVFKILSSSNVSILGTSFVGNNVSDLVSINNSSDIILSDNTFRRGRLGVSLSSNSSDISLSNNVFGGNPSVSDSTLKNGVYIMGGSNNIDIFSNNFAGFSSDSNSIALRILGNSSRQSLDIGVYNNIFGSMESRSLSFHASTFMLENCSDVKIHHNTVILSSTRDASQGFTEVFLFPDISSALVSSRNNLFSNTHVGGSVSYSHFIRVPSNPTVSTLFSESDYNMWNGSFQFIYIGDSQYGMSDWRTLSNKDAHSFNTLYGSPVLTLDGHLDGPTIGQLESLVPLLNDAGVDMDIDEQRGLDNAFPGMTTVGHDEVMFQVVVSDSLSDLPSEYLNCEDERLSIMLGVEKRFLRWNDGVSRSYYPSSVNTWYNSAGDTLLESAGYKTDYFPYLYIQEPLFEQSCSIRVITSIGYWTDASSWCNLVIIKLPEFTLQPEDSWGCINSGILDVPSGVYGSYVGLQWEKQSGSSWSSVSGQTSTTLHLDYTTDEVGANNVRGIYRLRIDPYIGMCSSSDVYYSVPIEVNVGYPLSRVDLSTDYSQSDLSSGICAGTALNFSVNVPDGYGTVVGYQWEKWDMNVNDYVSLPVEVYASAASSTYHIPSARIEDAGLYRCKVLGIAGCSPSYIYSGEVDLVVSGASYIATQPLPQVACLGSSLLYELSAAVVQADNVSFSNQYSWFKNGEELIRYNEYNEPVSPSDANWAMVRTDTTYLPFEELSYNDGAVYSLRMIYENCEGVLDTLFSNSVDLFIYSAPELIDYSRENYAFRGGYMLLNVEAIVPGATSSVPINYQWYRYTDGQRTLLLDDARVQGSNSAILTITPVQDSDINDQSKDDYYYCVVSGLCGGDTSTTEKIYVNWVPEILITNPSNTDRCESESASFRITATPSDLSDPISYRWYKDDSNTPLSDGGNITGSSTNELIIDPVLPGDAGLYKCQVSYTTHTAFIISNNARLLVEPSPIITDLTVDTTDADLHLEVSITDFNGGLYQYQWYKDGVPVGNDDASYWKYGADSLDNGTYYVVVTSLNGCGETTSQNITINNWTSISDDFLADFRILSVVPHPFSDDAMIKFILPEAAQYKFTLLDLTGKSVLDISSGYGTAGDNLIRLQANKSIPSGSYFILLESNGKQTTYYVTITK